MKNLGYATLILIVALAVCLNAFADPPSSVNVTDLDALTDPAAGDQALVLDNSVGPELLRLDALRRFTRGTVDLVSCGAVADYTLTSNVAGKVFYNAQATVVHLPSSGLNDDSEGLIYSFLVNHASNFDIDPDGTDQITRVTGTAGDYYRSSTVGSFLTVCGSGTNSWFVIDEEGTWAEE